MKASPVFLIGYMGSGKTTLGRQLSEHFNLSFIDLDQQIQSTSGLSITEIFDRFGEGYFRKLESNFLRQLPTDKAIIIALGGGTPCHSDNMAWVKANGLSVYIKVDTEVLQRRLALEEDIRPLIHPIPKAKRAAFIKAHLRSREAWYTQATFTYSPGIQSLNELINWLEENM